MRLGLVEEVDERDRGASTLQRHSAHADTVASSRPAGEREQGIGLARIELDLLPFLVEEPQRAPPRDGGYVVP